MKGKGNKRDKSVFFKSYFFMQLKALKLKVFDTLVSLGIKWFSPYKKNYKRNQPGGINEISPSEK